MSPRDQKFQLQFDVTGVILAGGASSRLGQPKQLLRYGNSTLLERIAQEAIACGVGQTLVVLGSNSESIRPTLRGLPVEIAINSNWREGVASSIRAAVQWFQGHTPNATGILFMASDQVLIDRSSLQKILSEFEGKPDRIVVSRYGRTPGIPAIFGRAYLPDLTSLRGDGGGQSLIRRYPKQVRKVPLPEAALDIDCWEDWEAFLASDTMRP